MIVDGETQFFSRTYGDAMRLLVEARDYFAAGGEGDPARLAYAAETLRVTARLTQIMAWLLAQRAVFGGEITRQEALRDPRPLAALDGCMDERGSGVAMPPRLDDLLRRSYLLYVRVARLDELARRALALEAIS